MSAAVAMAAAVQGQRVSEVVQPEQPPSDNCRWTSRDQSERYVYRWCIEYFRRTGSSANIEVRRLLREAPAGVTTTEPIVMEAYSQPIR